MTPDISVIIPTYNPRSDYLERVLDALKAQTLPIEKWELVIIDNCSANKTVFQQLDLSWHPNPKIVEEHEPGLTHARAKGFAETSAPLICMLDDDNVLGPQYLEKGTELFQSRIDLGAIGGKVSLEYETPPEEWMTQHLKLLAHQDYGDEPKYSNRTIPKTNSDYPGFSPVGAGMILRREVANQYLEVLAKRGTTLSDRKGSSLSSAGDNDIILVALKNQWVVGYHPELQIQHLIPQKRLTREYLSRLSEESSKSWVEVLSLHGIFPWPPISPISVPFRKLKMWFELQAWKNPSNYIRWKASCGTFEGQSQLQGKGGKY